MDRVKNKFKQLSINSQFIDWSVIAVVIFFIVCFGYQYMSIFDNHQTIEQNINIVEKQTETKKEIISQTLNKEVNALKTIAESFNNSPYLTEANALSFMNDQMGNWGFEKMALIDEDGYWEYQDGNGGSNGLSALEDMSDYKLSSPIETDGKYYIEVYVPLDTRISYSHKVALAGYYPVEKMTQELTNSVYEQYGTLKIVNSKGKVIIQDGAISQDDNILSAIKKSTLEHKTYDDVVSDLQGNKADYVKCSQDSDETYIYYTPINVNDWYLIATVSSSAIEVGNQHLFSSILTICIVIIVISAFCLVAGLLIYFFRNRQLEKLAYEDEVTEGSNRLFFEKNAEKMMKNSTYNYAIVYVNVEKFKVLNEHFGQTYANGILKNIYDLIVEQLDSKEFCARLVSDNYALLIHYESKKELIQRLDNLRIKCRDIMKKDGFIYQLQLTFGIYAVHERSIDIRHFIDCAYLANKNIEARYRNFYNFYDDKMQNVLLNEQKLEDKMQSALDNGNIRVYFEPKFNTRYGQIEGGEAIVRWIDAEQGIIHSNEFIPLFEKTGMIVKLDVYVFEKVCILLRKWIDMGIDVVPISVNISMENLYVYDFLDEYEKILQKYNIPGKLIEFEFKEVLMYENTDVLKGIIQRIHSMGCYCSMDEFGSGYTALNSIKQINVDILKIDKSFFNDERDVEKNREVIQGIVYLAKRLNLKTVAIGVEKQEDLDFLRGIDVDLVQGRVFSETLAAIDFEKKMSKGMN